jgi:outer membrane protein assembly factor BamB
MMYILTTDYLYGLTFTATGAAVSWSQPITTNGEYGAVAVGVDGTVFVASAGVMAVNGTTGAKVWPSTLRSDVPFCTLAIGPGDALFAGDHYGNLLAIW